MFHLFPVDSVVFSGVLPNNSCLQSNSIFLYKLGLGFVGMKNMLPNTGQFLL